MSIKNFDRSRIEETGENVFGAIVRIAKNARELVEDDENLFTSDAITIAFDKDYPDRERKNEY